MWLTLLAANAVFILVHPALRAAVGPLPQILQPLITGTVLFVLPATGWMSGFSTSRALGTRVCASLGISTLAMIVSVAALGLAGRPLTGVSLWNALWLLTNAGFVWGWRRHRQRRARRRRWLVPRETIAGLLLFVVSYTGFFRGATRIVPLQVDHDLEVLATGYGLLTRFEPLLLTDRHGVYFFAHPPLLHAYVAASFVLAGEANDLAFYDARSRTVRDAWRGVSVPLPTDVVTLDGDAQPYRVRAVDGRDYLMTREGGGPERRVSIEAVELGRIYAHYRKHPNLLAARTPNIVLASATVALMGLWLGRVSRRWWLAVLAATAYVITPEVFVRSSYGGYFAAGGLAAMFLLLSATYWRRQPQWRRAIFPLTAGVFASLVDHKVVLLPLTIAAVWWWETRHRRDRPLKLHPALAGFALGSAAFWSWGLLIDASAFVQDHLRSHLIERITHVNPLGYGGYPTVVDLWAEFGSHTAFILLPSALFLFARDLWRPGYRSAGFLDRITCLGWVAITGLVFSLVDWRMTKHLIPLVLPLLLIVCPDRRASRLRVVVAAAVLGLVIALQAPPLTRLIHDFTSFVVTPAW